MVLVDTSVWIDHSGGTNRASMKFFRDGFDVWDCGIQCGVRSTSLETIQVVLDSKLLRAAERVAPEGT